MKNIVYAVALASLAVGGCKKKKEEAPPATPASGSSMAGSSTASGSAPAGSGSAEGSGSAAAAGSGSGSAEPTKDEPAKPAKVGWGPVDDAIDGKSPWLSDANAKAGLVEMIVDDDLSGRTKGTFTTKRLCGDAAKKAAAKAGETIAKRSKDETYDQAVCREDGDPNKQLCLSMGLGEGDFSVLLEYHKVGDAWMIAGIQTTGVGINTEKWEKDYEKLLGTKCK